MPEIFQVQQVAAHVGVEAHLLLAAEHAHGARRAFVHRPVRVGGQALEPDERPLDLRLRVTRLLQFRLERLSTRRGVVLGVQEVLEQVDQDVEHAVLHRACLAVVRL